MINLFSRVYIPETWIVKELDRKLAGETSLKPTCLIVLQTCLCHNKVYEVNVFRLCFGIFTFAATEMASENYCYLTEIWDAFLTLWLLKHLLNLTRFQRHHYAENITRYNKFPIQFFNYACLKLAALSFTSSACT